ncbi:MAG: MOSC domain-containing protein [Trueperaceae bacterium]
MIANHGAQGDRHAGRDSTKAVLVTGAGSYDYLAEQGLQLPYGALGENLVVRGLEPEDLPVATTLQIGEVLLELTTPCTVCSNLSVVNLRLPKLVYGRRGVYARIVRGGEIEVGDRVEI